MRDSKKRASGGNKRKRQHGAVTIFLIIVLVPCIALTSICVDLSRVQLSKAMATSSADLALNTLLTNYDGDLNDWYGMIGSCQNIEDFYKVSAGYFLRAISSKGLGQDEIFLLSDVYSSVTGDDSIFDLLQTEAVGDVSVSEVKDANLSNPTLIKDQIVEFMKYRAPIELTMGIIDRLGKDSSYTDAKEAKKNEPLVESKQEFYTAEGELLKKAYNTYWTIINYRDEVDRTELTNEKLLEYANQVNACRSAYETLHALAVSNLFNTDSLNYTYKRKICNTQQYYYYDMDDMSFVYAKSEEDEETGETVYYTNNSKFSKYTGKARDAIQAFDSAKKNYENAVSGVMASPPGSNDVNAIQWWVRMHRAVYETNGNLHSQLSSAADTMAGYIQTLSALMECEEQSNSSLPEDWKSQCASLRSQIESRCSKYLSGSPDWTDAYVNAAQTFANVSSANIKNVKSSQLQVTVNGATTSFDAAISKVSGDLTKIYADLTAARDLLNTAIDGDGGETCSLDKLKQLAIQYGSALNTYQGMADNTGTDMAGKEKDEIKTEIEEGRIEKGIDEAGVRELKTRLTNIRSQLNKIIQSIENMKYGNVCVKDISSFSAFRQAALTKVHTGEIPLKNADISSYARSTFSSLYKPDGTAVQLENTSGNSHNPKLNLKPKDPAETDTPKLLIYLHSKFDGRDKASVDENQQDLDSGKENQKNEESRIKDSPRFHGNSTGISKSYSNGTAMNLTDGLFGSLMELLEILTDTSNVTSIRDDLYITSYIMSMFSYGTYETEGQYGLVKEKTKLSLPETGYRPAEYDNVLGDAGTEKTWLSSNEKDSYNKTLTNKLINSANNVAWGAEVEYILNGSADNKENVKAVYSDIYVIRYALNLVSVFQNFWKANTQENTTAIAIETAANGIATATGGIIPPPVTKVVALPLLAVFETGRDLDRLEAGFPVELYKRTYEDWWVQIPSISNIASMAAGKPTEKKNTDKGIFYSDYLTVFVYLGLKSSKCEQMYYRIAEVIESNMAKATGGGYKMSKVRMYFTLDATLRVKPLMVTLPYYFDEYENTMAATTDWCTYKVKTTRGYT